MASSAAGNLILYLFLIPPVVGADRVTALVECGHRFVSRSNLDLHKVGLCVVAGRAISVRRIDVLPGSSSAHNVIHFLEIQIGIRGSLGYTRWAMHLPLTWDRSAM